jgi:hypothetical protein
VSDVSADVFAVPETVIALSVFSSDLRCWFVA